MTVCGVVVGSRKAGTTWLYENFLRDPEVSVSRHVKESRFFLGAMDESTYDALFDGPASVPRLEVDTGLATHDVAARRISEYNSQMNVLLILREPAAFAASRFVHGIRKGEFAYDSIGDAITRDAQFRAELDYASIIERFGIPAFNFKAMRYESLLTDAAAFYVAAKSHLAGRPLTLPPSGTDRVNVARESRFPAASKMLASGASFARRHNLHRLVNVAKGMRLHQRLDRPRPAAEQEALIKEARQILRRTLPETVAIYEACRW